MFLIIFILEERTEMLEHNTCIEGLTLLSTSGKLGMKQTCFIIVKVRHNHGHNPEIEKD